MAAPTTVQDNKLFSNLGGHQFMSLTTFRKTGQPVKTPVWFVDVGGKLYVTTQQDAGKVKRIRHTPRVTVEPCTARGDILGPSQEGQARELSTAEHATADAALTRKYGWQKRAFDLMGKLSGRKRTYLEITPR